MKNLVSIFAGHVACRCLFTLLFENFIAPKKQFLPLNFIPNCKVQPFLILEFNAPFEVDLFAALSPFFVHSLILSGQIHPHSNKICSNPLGFPTQPSIMTSSSHLSGKLQLTANSINFVILPFGIIADRAAVRNFS